jgi:hypothetical protein
MGPNPIGYMVISAFLSFISRSWITYCLQKHAREDLYRGLGKREIDFQRAVVGELLHLVTVLHRIVFPIPILS